jgi:hypothetical protein
MFFSYKKYLITMFSSYRKWVSHHHVLQLQKLSIWSPCSPATESEYLITMFSSYRKWVSQHHVLQLQKVSTSSPCSPATEVSGITVHSNSKRLHYLYSTALHRWTYMQQQWHYHRACGRLRGLMSTTVQLISQIDLNTCIAGNIGTFNLKKITHQTIEYNVQVFTICPMSQTMYMDNEFILITFNNWNKCLVAGGSPILGPFYVKVKFTL